MNQPIFFRRATSGDAEAVACVLIDSRARFMAYAPSAHADALVREWVGLVLLRRERVTVAVAGEQVVGVLATHREGGTSWISQLSLDPAWVNRGIGSQLLELAVAELSKPIRLKTFTANVGARRFYERHGFVAIEFTNGASNEEHVPDVLYELK